MNDCIFCKIVSGEIPSYKIYEDEYAYAFLDISCDSVGHTRRGRFASGNGGGAKDKPSLR